MHALIQRITQSDEVLAAIIAFILSLIGVAIIWIFTPRGKVAWALFHQQVFLLRNQQPNLLVNTRNVWVQNVGRAMIESVEVIFNYPPQHFEVWPQRKFTTETNPHNNFILRLETLNSKEWVNIALLSAAQDIPTITNVRWSGGQGKELPMAPQRVWPNWFIKLLSVLLILGMFTVIYLVVRLIQNVAT